MNQQSSVSASAKANKISNKLLPITVIVVLGLAALWIILTVVVPLSMGDGLGGYTGAKLTAAKNAVAASQSPIDNKLRWSYSFHVDEVRPVSSSEISQSCHNPSFITQDPNNAAYYTVVVSQKRLLQLGSETNTYIGCDSVSQY